jgi:hypothetical protein
MERKIDYDVSLTKARRDATTYPKLVVQIAKRYGKEIPPHIEWLLDPEACRQLRL